MLLNNKYNLIFIESTYLFTNKDIFLYVHCDFFIKFINANLLVLKSNPTKDLVSFSSTNKHDISYHLENYIDDLDKFDFQNRKYRLSKKNLKIKKAKFKKSSSSKTHNLSWSIYDSSNGLLKTVKAWNYYLTGRYGVGYGLTSLFAKYNGTLVGNYISMDTFSTYVFRASLRSFFLKNLGSFDYLKAKLEIYSYLKHKNRFTFKGWCFLNRYPVNGQKRRTNYKTTRNYNQFIMLKMSK